MIFKLITKFIFLFNFVLSVQSNVPKGKLDQNKIINICFYLTIMKIISQNNNNNFDFAIIYTNKR
jgi:hypothetical protein